MSKSLESVIKSELGLSTLKSLGLGGGGCINQGTAYDTDKYGRVFVKVNSKSGARTMFDGEYASLEALSKPDIVRVPKPIKVVDQPGGGAALVMEYLDMSGGLSRHSALLGKQLATLHLHNASLGEKSKKAESSVHKDDAGEEYVSQFGFHINTCCGYLEMDNTWCDDWPTFYAKKIEKHINMVEKAGDRQARELWNKVLAKWSDFFEGIEIKPAIVHGDLWGGNVSENKDGPAGVAQERSNKEKSEYLGDISSHCCREGVVQRAVQEREYCTVIFDPASFYGHHEFDLGISYLFGGFDSKFYNAYHEVIPKGPGFQKRKDLYRLFHYLNHWNHFGGGYRSSSLSTLQACINHLYK